jgi:hypothetical protein
LAKPSSNSESVDIMALNNNGQLAAWEALIIIVLMAACAWMFYLYAHKPSENSIYQSGSKPHVTDIHVSPFGFGCISEGAYERMMKNAVPTNSQTNRT